MDQQKSPLTQSPLEKEIQSFTRAVSRAESQARGNSFTNAIIALGDAFRSVSVIMGVVIKTVDMLVKENKALKERVETLERLHHMEGEESTPPVSTNG